MGRLAQVLVFGMLALAVTSSALLSYLVYRITHFSRFSLLVFAASLSWWFFRVVGGPKGLQRAVGEGTWSLLLGRHDPSKLKPSENLVRTVVISDTHNKHVLLTPLPAGDLLIHCGDATMKGTAKELHAFLDWFESQPFQHKIFVPGNHDTGLEVRGTHGDDEELARARERLEQACVVLRDETKVVAGLTVYGTPWTPYITESRKGAYQDREGSLASHFDFPADLDVLVSHGPPHGYGDRAFIGKHVGDKELLAAIKKRPPRYHFCGHIHEGYESRMTEEGVVFANASSANLLYQAKHVPLVFDIPRR